MCDWYLEDVVLVPGTPEQRGVWCDPCLAPLVGALNAAGIRTVASCCGHGRGAGSIIVAAGDGHIELLITAFESGEGSALVDALRTSSALGRAAWFHAKAGE